MIIFITSAIMLLFAWVTYYIFIIKPVNDEQKDTIQEGKKKAEIDKIFNDDPYAFPWQATEDV